MTPQPPWMATDAVGQALHFLRMNGVFYCRSQLTEPWGVSVPPVLDCLWFHVVTSGHALLEVAGARSRRLVAGDVGLIPRGSGHAVRSAPDAPAPLIQELDRAALGDRYETLRHGGGGPATVLICGAVRFDHPSARGLVDLLPEILHVEASPRTERMQATLRLMAAEVEEVRPGGEAVVTRLADVLVVQAIRSWLEHDPAARTGWLGALADPQIGRALAMIHSDPAREWTVASLACAVAMSRSAFAARFTQLVGEPAMAYVTRWRMYVAVDLLEAPGTTVAGLAGRLGYRSEAAFSRAFKRVIGSAPGALRRSTDEQLEALFATPGPLAPGQLVAIS